MSQSPAPMIIDFHTHVFPYRIDPLLEKVSIGPLGRIPARRPIEKLRLKLRKKGRGWVSPLSHVIHGTHPWLRFFPESIRGKWDQLAEFLARPSLWVESVSEDLIDAMDEARVQRALILANPPQVPNEFILKESVRNPRMIPAVSVNPSREAAAQLKRWIHRGAKALKIHPQLDRHAPEHPHSLMLLEQAQWLGVPVILHTGSAQDQIYTERFTDWFSSFPKLPFVLARMNTHAPEIALALGERFPNLYVDTAWQPPEAIRHAVDRLGADRVLFASDWPAGGKNIAVGLRRIEECVQMGRNPDGEKRLLLGENAARLLGLANSDASRTHSSQR